MAGRRWEQTRANLLRLEMPAISRIRSATHSPDWRCLLPRWLRLARVRHRLACRERRGNDDVDPAVVEETANRSDERSMCSALTSACFARAIFEPAIERDRSSTKATLTGARVEARGASGAEKFTRTHRRLFQEHGSRRDRFARSRFLLFLILWFLEDLSRADTSSFSSFRCCWRVGGRRTFSSRPSARSMRSHSDRPGTAARSARRDRRTRCPRVPDWHWGGEAAGDRSGVTWSGFGFRMLRMYSSADPFEGSRARRRSSEERANLVSAQASQPAGCSGRGRCSFCRRRMGRSPSR